MNAQNHSSRVSARSVARVLPALAVVIAVVNGGTASAAPIGGSQILSVTTTATIVNSVGGSTNPAALLDGDISGASGTFVELHVNQLPGALFRFEFDAMYDVEEFKLWNDRGAPDSGIDGFRLHFLDDQQTLIGSTGVLNASAIHRGNNTTAEVFSFGKYRGVKYAELEILSGLTQSHVQVREIAFCGDRVPEPSAVVAALLAVCSASAVGVRTRLG